MSEQRVALVTGTNRGAGNGIARALHAAGYRVISLNRTPGGAPELGEIVCDLTDPAAIAEALAEVRRRTDRLDLCVWNAAVRRLGAMAELDEESWAASVSTNLLAPALLTRGTLPMLRESGGMYVFVGSHAATRYFEGGAAYSATKAGLKALVEVLLLEERGNGVRAVLVSPGAIANRAWDDSPTKISTDSFGSLVVGLVDRMPADLAVGEIEVRPAALEPEQGQEHGIARLQRV
ncbi:SDR family oxidoreductase [Kitasatospora sp. McL0602]|uniref:SDR family oxidoreductase n=1 Tax=Kitasatospora sp. McL0602 TaxID=3439530 RepID=UPI003F88B8EE